MDWKRPKISKIISWFCLTSVPCTYKMGGAKMKLVLYQAFLITYYFEIFWWSFSEKSLWNFSKNWCFSKMSSPARRASTLVGLNHLVINCPRWSRTYGASRDSSLFSFGGVSAAKIGKSCKLHIFRLFTSVKAWKRLDWFFHRLLSLVASIKNISGQGYVPRFIGSFSVQKIVKVSFHSRFLETSCTLTRFKMAKKARLILFQKTLEKASWGFEEFLRGMQIYFWRKNCGKHHSLRPNFHLLASSFHSFL